MANTKLKYRAYYGFKPNEYISIEEQDLEKVLYCMQTGDLFRGIKGTVIQRLEEDFRYYTGWYDSYSPADGDDQKQLERDVPTKELEERRQLALERVNYVQRTGQEHLLANASQIDLLLLKA